MQNRTNSLLPIFKMKWKTKKVEGFITYSTDQKFSNSRLILELTKNYEEFMLNLKSIIPSGQLMLFYNIWVSILQVRIQML